MIPGIYTDIGSDAKRTAVDKVSDSFDVGSDSLYNLPSPSAMQGTGTGAGTLAFSVERL